MEYKNYTQIINNKEKYIGTLLNQAMRKDMDLDKIHNEYNVIVVEKDMTLQNFSEKHNTQISSISQKYSSQCEDLSKKFELRID